MAVQDPDQRVLELQSLYDGPAVCLAELLCDQYPDDAIAYRVVAADLSVTTYTYGALRLASTQFAQALVTQGISSGDRVATLMGKGWAFLVAVMGIWRLGAVHVPLFTAFAPPAIAMRLSRSATRLVVVDASQRDKLNDPEISVLSALTVVSVADSQANDLAFWPLVNGAPAEALQTPLRGDAPMIEIYTSGTTGNPKGVVVPIKAVAAFRAYAEFGFDLRPDDVFWNAADPGWAYGLYLGVLATLSTGTPAVMLEGGFDAQRTLQVLSRLGVTNFAAAPTVYRALLSAEGEVPSGMMIRCASSAGEPLTPEINEWAEANLGVTVHDHYGQTEGGMMINNHHHPSVAAPVKPGAMGRSMPGWRAAVLDNERDEEVAAGVVGRIVIDCTRSPLSWFAWYVDDPEKTAERYSADGRWYLTGDTGYVDESGDFHFSSRDDDLILMAGYRIGPFEIESVLVQHPAVVESAVIAVPDTLRGEVIESFVVLAEGVTGNEALVAELQQWVKKRFAAHAYPRVIHFVEALPKTPSGKIQRFQLKKQRIAELA